MDGEVRFRIILEKPPAGVDFGLQKGRGNDYETVQTRRSAGGDLSFEFTARVKPGPDFAGPFIQGPKGERFVYIDIGTYAGEGGSQWSRRLKVPLTGITQVLVDELAPDALLETRVPGTGKDGGPNCATVKPFSGWQPR